MSSKEEILGANKENEAKRILGKESVTDEEIEKVFEIYGTFDFFNEYLVNGAILTCDQSTRKLKKVEKDGRSHDFSVVDNGIKAEKAQVDEDKVLGKLTVTQTNSAITGEQKHATVADYCFDKNIPCFGNCNNEQYNKMEIKYLLEKGVRDSTHGTCKHLIRIASEWEDEDLLKSPLKFSTDEGMKDGITMTNALFCSHGGWIYPVTSGQSDYTVDDAKAYAISMMQDYLGGILSEEEAEKVILFLDLVLPGIAQVKKKKPDAWEKEWKSKWEDDKYDAYIKAWTYYWNQEIANGFFGDIKFEIRTEVVKAMIMEESSWGTPAKKNTGRDVMQALYPGDYALWILSGYNPLEVGMSHRGTDEDVVWVKDGVNYDPASRRSSFNYMADETTTATEQAGFGQGLGILRDNVITVISADDAKGNEAIKAAEGEYLIHYDEVTPNMSIACGIGYLAYKIQSEDGSEVGGVREYNGGGQEKKSGEKDAYVKSVNEHLEHLITNDGQMVKELQG